jgi:hypothetical protein
MAGVVGKMMQEFALTVAVAIVVSLCCCGGQSRRQRGLECVGADAQRST